MSVGARIDIAPPDLSSISLPKIEESNRKRYIPPELIAQKNIESDQEKQAVQVRRVEVTPGRIRVGRKKSIDSARKTPDKVVAKKSVSK
jgi:hypothetical protein